MEEVKKYIIEFSEDPTKIKLLKMKNGKDGLPVFEFKTVTPYIEDSAYAHGYTEAESKYREIRDELEKQAYQRGYDDAKHECQDCQKIMMDAEQERVGKAYQQGLEDARNRKATCEFCEYAGNDESDEPCVRCCCGYMNMFRPKGVVPKADSRIRKKIEGIMESLDCTISDFEKAIEEMKNEAD